jgi:hypothetical protein
MSNDRCSARQESRSRDLHISFVEACYSASPKRAQLDRANKRNLIMISLSKHC